MLLNCDVGEDSWDLDCKKIQPLHSKGDQSWVFIGRTDVEAETPILWPPDAKNWLTRKYPDSGKDWGQDKGTKEDEMVEWHHRLSGHGFEWTARVGDGQGGLACCGSWDHKESDTAEWLNWTELMTIICLLLFYRLLILKLKMLWAKFIDILIWDKNIKSRRYVK